jgi:Fe2+ or Zn2+ uptake regulation protein
MLQNKEEKETLLKEILTKLQEKGYKLTESRKRVIKYLLEHGRHFDIEEFSAWVYGRCGGRKDCPSRPTVYRTVKLLEKLGFVKSVLKTGGKTIYELAPVKGEHYHLVCLKCGKLVEFEVPHLGEIIKEITNKYGFQYLHHRLEVFGICPECLKKEMEEK